MATLHPDVLPAQIPETRQGERAALRALRQLPGSFHVFYSVRIWEKTDYGRRKVEREADFVVVHPDHGVVVIEVKGGEDIQHFGGAWRWASGAPMKPQPDVQAHDAMHALGKLLKEDGLSVPYAWAVWFPHVEAVGRFPPGTDPTQVMGSIEAADTDILQESIAAIARVRASPRTMTPRELRRSIELLEGKIHVFAPIGQLVGEAMQAHWRLDQSQQEAYRWMLHGRSRLLCEGGAGTVMGHH